MTPKKGRERGRNPWLSAALLALALLAAAVPLAFWLLGRETPATPLKYGELVQLCIAAKHDPSISLQHVQVNHSDIRGDVVFSDLVGDQIVAFYKQYKEFGITANDIPICTPITTEQEIQAMGPENAVGHYT